MQCSDLERYLEAFLDGRLGRGRTAILRRHLAGCLVCRARFERLRQFERDLALRLRTLQRCESVWAALELDLVKSGEGALPDPVAAVRSLPPPSPPSLAALPPAGSSTAPPRPAEAANPRQRRTGRLVGLALFAASAGLTFQLGFWLLERSGGASAPSVAVGRSSGEATRELRSGDRAAVRDWLTAGLGGAVPELPAPSEFELVGARLETLDGKTAGVVLFRRGGETVSLYFMPRRDAHSEDPGNDLLTRLAGGARLAWQDREFSYAVVSALPAAELTGLGRPAALR
ncbi:MAG: zf-HC2 domain-containing protein [Geminicoccaceae bacterium]|nr:zf-HC2 domain-containing protein [Geminicoccaceae bacterium]